MGSFMLKTQMPGKDLLLVTSDSGKLSFLTFCNVMHRFFSVTHIQLSEPNNSRSQIGRMIAVHSSGGYIVVSAFEEHLALLSVSSDNTCDMIDKKLIYPPEESNEEEGEEEDAIKGIQKGIILGTIWSMCFISKSFTKSSKEDCPVLAILLNRCKCNFEEVED